MAYGLVSPTGEEQRSRAVSTLPDGRLIRHQAHILHHEDETCGAGAAEVMPHVPIFNGCLIGVAALNHGLAHVAGSRQHAGTITKKRISQKLNKQHSQLGSDLTALYVHAIIN